MTERRVLCVDGPLRGQFRVVAGSVSGFIRHYADPPDAAAAGTVYMTARYRVSELVTFSGTLFIASCRDAVDEVEAFTEGRDA